MRRSFLRPAGVRARVLRACRRFRGDARGVTAVEFALVAGPFLLLAMGIITIGLQHLTSHFLEHGVEEAARRIRTGELQQGNVTLAGFRQIFCDEAGFMIKCDDEHLVLHIKSSDTFAGLSPVTKCVTNGRLTPSEGNPGDAVRSRTGGASQGVVVSACYQWDMGLALWQTIWNLLSPTPTVQGKPVLTAVAAFRSEPFPD